MIDSERLRGFVDEQTDRHIDDCKVALTTENGYF